MDTQSSYIHFLEQLTLHYYNIHISTYSQNAVCRLFSYYQEYLLILIQCTIKVIDIFIAVLNNYVYRSEHACF